jgi:3-hydroxybutyryl-CoA dehydrogenase
LGRKLAVAAARAGLRVFLEDVMPATLKHAQEFIRREISAESIAQEHPRMAFVSSVEDAVREADLAIDCVPDELESKLEILLLIDRMAPPRTVIATPTTQLSIADLAACTYRPDKCVALQVDTRGWTDPLPNSIVLRRTQRTSPEAVDTMTAFWEAVGVTLQVVQELDPHPPADSLV